MEGIDWKVVIFILLVLDSVGAVILSFSGPLWWPKYFAPLAKWFPLAKGWSLLYLGFVLVLGYYMFS
jgi:hypothetical protein